MDENGDGFISMVEFRVGLQKWVRLASRNYYVADRNRWYLAMGFLRISLGQKLPPLTKERHDPHRYMRLRISNYSTISGLYALVLFKNINREKILY